MERGVTLGRVVLGRGQAIVAVAVALMAVVAVIGIPFYVLPASDAPRDVDVVYVIGPPSDPRMALAEQVIADGHADTLLISMPDADGEFTTSRETYERAIEICDEGADVGVQVICLQPEPFTTRGEARALDELAEIHGWESASVITFTPHITRTRIIMEQCWDGELSYLDPGAQIAPWTWAYQYAYQSAALVKVALEGGC